MGRRSVELASEMVNVAKAGLSYRKGLPARVSTLHRHRADSTALEVHMRPVVLLHGFAQTVASLDVLRRRCAQAGFDTYTFNYKTLGVGVESAGARLAAELPGIVADAGADRAHIVAHSMGGLVARAALADPDAAAATATVTTLGTPHAGTPLAMAAGRLLPGASLLIGEFMPGSRVLSELDAAPPPEGVTWTAYYSPDDRIVPGARGRMDVDGYGARNVEVAGLGHAGLIYDRRVVDAVVAELVADSRTMCARRPRRR